MRSPVAPVLSAQPSAIRRELGVRVALAEEARTSDPSYQDAPLSRPRRAVRLPGLHLRSGSALADRKKNPLARPSKKAQKRLKEKINTLLFRGNPTPWPELHTRLNRLLLGWAEYFSFGLQAKPIQRAAGYPNATQELLPWVANPCWGRTRTYWSTKKDFKAFLIHPSLTVLGLAQRT
jgi:Group II intron, maturase-specific domain